MPAAAERASGPGDLPSPDLAAIQADIEAALADAFALSDATVTELGRLIYAANLAAYVSAYTAEARNAGAILPADWQPSDATLAALAQDALTSASQIAATYHDDLGAAASKALDDWFTAHPDLVTALDASDMTGETANALARQAERELAAEMRAWASQRAEWKAAQIGRYEAGKAAHTATQAVLSDAQDGALTGEDGAALDTSGIEVAVLPSASSGDYCANYAGRVFGFDDAPSISFPAHVGCIHTMEIIISLEYSLDTP